MDCSSDTTGSLPFSSAFDLKCLSTLLSVVHSSPEAIENVKEDNICGVLPQIR